MSSSKLFSILTSGVSEDIIITPPTSATPLDKPTWVTKPTFEPSLESTREDLNDIGDNWNGGDWGTEKVVSALNPIEAAEWGLGRIVEVQDPHTHFTIFDSMDQRSGYTHYILQSNRGFLFHGHEYTTQWKAICEQDGDGSEFASLPRDCFPARLLFPKYFPWMTIFHGKTEDKSVYMKKQAFLTRDKFKSTHHAGCTMQEVFGCEHISKTPHPNLAQYLGVETSMLEDEQRVTKIAYKRYSMDLHSFVMMKRYLQPHQIDFLMQGIEKGMRHLHKLGLVHCDLRPMNVFVSIEDETDDNEHVILKEVVLGDFDASVAIGEEISLKRASKDWWPETADDGWGTKAEEWIDQWCLEKMGKWLKEDGLGEWDFRGSDDAS